MSLCSPLIQQALTVALTQPAAGWVLGIVTLVSTVVAACA